jgi:hypothetical protein
VPPAETVKQIFNSTNKDFYVVMDKLKRVVSNGNYHIDLTPNHLIPKAETAKANIVQVIDGIPTCCRISLKDQTAPLVIKVAYKTQGDLKVFISQK